MIAEDKLIGWLCFLRLTWGEDQVPAVPDNVSDSLIARGWITKQEDPDWQGRHEGRITDAGWAITDLHGADWGIDTIPSESEA